MFGRGWRYSKRAIRFSPFLLEAFCELCIARFKVWFVPFRRYKKELGKHMHTSPEQVAETDMRLSKRLGWAVRKAAKLTPFRSTCLVQAMAAKRMLNKRGISSTLYIGLAKDERAAKAISNHAWLRAGSDIITGYLNGLANYAVIGTYAEERA